MTYSKTESIPNGLKEYKEYEISAVDVSSGKLSMDALNLSQKVYNMLNRIVVSGGTYRDWLETVYTGSNYLERCETPTFEGGKSQEIVFQEVVSN